MADPSYTATDLGLAVSIGELKTDVRNVLTGLDDIKTTIGNFGARLGGLETAHAVTSAQAVEARREAAEAKAEAMRLRSDLDTAQQGKEARKPPWTAIVAVVVATAALVKQYLGF